MTKCSKCGAEFADKGKLMTHSRLTHPRTRAPAAPAETDNNAISTSVVDTTPTTTTATTEATSVVELPVVDMHNLPPPPPPSAAVVDDAQLAMKLRELDASMAARGMPPARLRPAPARTAVQEAVQYPPQEQAQPQPQQQPQGWQPGPLAMALINMGTAFAGAMGQVAIQKLMPSGPDPFHEIGLANYKVYTDQLSRTAGRLTGARINKKARKEFDDAEEAAADDDYEMATKRAIASYMDREARRAEQLRKAAAAEASGIPAPPPLPGADDAPGAEPPPVQAAPADGPQPKPRKAKAPADAGAQDTVQEYDHTSE